MHQALTNNELKELEQLIKTIIESEGFSDADKQAMLSIQDDSERPWLQRAFYEGATDAVMIFVKAVLDSKIAPTTQEALLAAKTHDTGMLGYMMASHREHWQTIERFMLSILDSKLTPDFKEMLLQPFSGISCFNTCLCTKRKERKLHPIQNKPLVLSGITQASDITWKTIQAIGMAYTPSSKHVRHVSIHHAMHVGLVPYFFQKLAVTDPIMALKVIYMSLYSTKTEIAKLIDRVFSAAKIDLNDLALARTVSQALDDDEWLEPVFCENLAALNKLGPMIKNEASAALPFHADFVASSQLIDQTDQPEHA